ncbi:uncharacterized protein LOC127375108 [Dicentrarchus labrax]|uniref:uncharacterized protein LOC127375108 n=1 Tax=Dicentrarchus labrax TaxID=13489 RepID=UPI0021F51A68|nr:uncharacterized protein LOC127375108 [Dicentrarchus labrax]
MWCYQKPGFEVLLLAELQRQQQCSQFCDTLLKTEGVSVPAHSCILSAISPDISSALSSTPPPPAGQSRLLEFRALGARTLLRMVRLLYSGEMAGEGEEEKQEAISAAARLGIHGLVEVTRRDSKRRHEEEGQHAEVGVQTEPLMQEENEGRRGRWRREVRDGNTFLWKETLSDGERDTWTQTEELEADTAPPPHPAASYETIDIAALQSLGQTHPNLLPPQIPYVPISLVYPLDENQTHQPSSALVAPLYTSASPSHLPFPSQATPSAADPPSCWAGPQRAAAEECEDEQLEQFQGNIPGYINYFLNPNKEEDSRRGRPRRRQGAGVGGARRAGTGERRARRPPAKAGGRGRGGLTQRVDVQEVGVSRLQKLFLQRGGMRASRTGQGGGAAGRKLYLRTRELLKQTKSCQRRRGRSKVWEFSLSGDVPPFYQEGAGNKQRGRRSTAPQFNQDGPPGRAQKARTKPTTSVSFSSPPMQVYNIHTLPASSPSLKPSPSPALLSPAASYASRESSFLHTASVPPPAPPPHEEQPEHFDRLLEEVMMGLDILPNNSDGARHSQLPLSSSSSSRTYGNTLGQNKQQSRNSGLLEAGPGFHGSTQVVAVRGGGSSSANSEVPILQQQGEGELNEMLEHFLMSFEQHVDSSASRDEVEMGGQSRPEAPVRSSQKLQQSDGAKTPATQPRKASAHNAAPPEHNEGTPSVSKRRKKQRKKEYLFSLEKKRVRVKKPVSSSNAKTKIVHDRGDKQLQQIPVVKLERSGLLPVKVALQGHSCQSLDLKSVAKAKTSSSSVKCPHDSLSGNNQRASWSTKTYPIRSRCREASMDSTPFLEEPFLPKPPPGRKRGRPKKNGQLPSLSNGESSTPPIQPQPVDEQLEKNQEKREEEFTVQPQEEAEGPTRRGEKRGAESKGETSDDATVAKKVCSETTPQPTSETCTPISVQFEPAATEIEDVIDVETVSLTGDCLQSEEQEEKLVFSVIRPGEAEERLMDEDAESSGDEIIDVDGDVEKDSEKERHQSGTEPTLCCLTEEKPSVSPPSHSAEEVVLGSAGSWEEDENEDIDVIGGSSPVPDPVIISWTESSEGEEEEGDEEVDVIGGKTDYTPSVVLAAISKSELVNGKYQTEVRLH